MYERLKSSIESSLVIDRNGYPYMINPVSDGIPRMDPDILDDITDWMISVCDFDCDVIAAPETMGIPFAVSLSLRLRIPYTVIRKRSYGIPGELAVHYRTGYSERILYINGLKAGDRTVIVDDVLSTGGTIAALTDVMEGNGISVTDVLVAFNKGSAKEQLKKDHGINVKSMFDLSVENNDVRIKRS